MANGSDQNSITDLFADIELKENKGYTFETQGGDTFLFINDGDTDLNFAEDNFIKITGFDGDIGDLTIG